MSFDPTGYTLALKDIMLVFWQVRLFYVGSM